MSSYKYSSYSRTTTTTTNDGASQTTTTTRTATGDSSSVVIRELTENEVSNLSLSDSTSNYEISDEDRLTEYDFYSLMDSEDDLESESESESDVEYHWFPSLSRNSIIHLLDDKENENYMDDDAFDKEAQIIEKEDGEDNEEDKEEEEGEEEEEEEEEEEGEEEEEEEGEEEEEEDDTKYVKNGGKRYFRHRAKKHSKRPRRTEQVPVEVILINY
jgi:hypothetical protein